MEICITALGTGSAFTTENYQSNFIVEINNKKLLIDCGTDIRHSLKTAQMTSADIDAIYISHLHSDHCGGMEYVALTTYFNPNKDKPALYAKPIVLQGLWEVLRQGLIVLNDKLAAFKDYFNIYHTQSDFEWQNTKFELVQTTHCKNAFALMPSFGLWIPDVKVLLTTDTQFDLYENRKELYEKADTIFQDCETAKFPTGVHAHYNDLKTLPPEIKAKMYLYHYQDGELPDAEADGFKGFMKQGTTFYFGQE